MQTRRDGGGHGAEVHRLPSTTFGIRLQVLHTPEPKTVVGLKTTTKDEVDREAWGYSNSVPSSDIPKTESSSSVERQWASDNRLELTGHDENEDEEEEESGTGLHSGCWVDPMHALGGGSSLARHGDKDDGRTSEPQPVSNTTPNFSWGIHRWFPGTSASQHDDDQTTEARVQELCDNASENCGDGEGDEPVDCNAGGDGGEDNEEEHNPLPVQADYARLARMVSLDNKQLQAWFANRRQRDQLTQNQGTGTANIPTYTGTHAYEPLASPVVRADPANGWLKFGDICTAAQADETTRDRCLRLISGHSVVSLRQNEQWILFKDGRFLCHKLGLDPTFLMSCPQAPAPAELPRLRATICSSP
ncbi:hypothetical protein SEPCBS57363_006070 [Sporothrix epigloea]|uniref:Homeobox domain-containing protein n=1 Tax=Sporothrix epigloea TaxID=1892477 RepID=A0ABP0E108_9PEZI